MRAGRGRGLVLGTGRGDGISRLCSLILLARQRSRQGSTLRTCRKSWARTIAAAPSRSRNLAGSLPDTWVTACSLISAIRGRMRTVPGARYAPGWDWSRPWEDFEEGPWQDCGVQFG